LNGGDYTRLACAPLFFFMLPFICGFSKFGSFVTVVTMEDLF
jgi:hypothetical protein